ncbi:MAG TPA: hypothetical protein VF710_13325 [Longimicrobium sp.]|jgi:hypothetical protein
MEVDCRSDDAAVRSGAKALESFNATAFDLMEAVATADVFL